MHDLSFKPQAPAPLPRVVALLERYGRVLSPCASIRLSAFLDVLRAQNRIDLRYAVAAELRSCQADVIVWHRTSLAPGDDLRCLQKAAARTGARLVYDLDDNLLELGNHPEHAEYRDLVESVESSLALADEVWCSTAPLVDAVLPVARGKVRLMKNALDPVLWAHEATTASIRERDGVLRLLYMGTRTHDDDFALLERAMELLHKEEPGRYRLTLLGGIRREALRYPWLDMLHPPVHVGASYPAFVGWFRRLRGFDLGVAPLLDNAFNRCKSAIKVLDYAAIGLPTLASRVPAYATDLVDGQECHLIDNDAGEWAQRIRSLAKDHALLARVNHGAQKLIGQQVFEAATQTREVSLLGTDAR